MNIPQAVIAEYRKWHNNWDDLCDQCGLCCYTRSFSSAEGVAIDYSDPCEFLDEETHLCRVFEDRFRVCKTCGKVNLLRALFSPILPPICAYVRTFRPLLRGEEDSTHR